MEITDPEEVGFHREFSTVVTEKMVQQFAEMSGDFNPIHMDEAYAQTTLFKGRIAHGMIVGALISRALNDGLGSGGIYLSQHIKFAKPVRINDTVTVHVKVLSMRKERGIASIETNAFNQHGEAVAKGEAMIMMSRGIK